MSFSEYDLLSRIGTCKEKVEKIKDNIASLVYFQKQCSINSEMREEINEAWESLLLEIENVSYFAGEQNVLIPKSLKEIQEDVAKKQKYKTVYYNEDTREEVQCYWNYNKELNVGDKIKISEPIDGCDDVVMTIASVKCCDNICSDSVIHREIYGHIKTMES